MRNNRQKNDTSPLMEFIKKYWLVVVGVIVGMPFLLRYLKDAQTEGNKNDAEEAEKNLVIANQNPLTQLEELNKITKDTFYHNLARNVAIHFGYDIQTKDSSWLAFLNPYGWTENDQKAYNELKKLVNSGQKRTVTACYYILTRRNLSDDVKKKLDSDLLIKLPLFK